MTYNGWPARQWAVGQLADFELAGMCIELEQTITTRAPREPDADAPEREVCVRVYRDMRQAKAAQLAGLRESATELLDTYERFLGGDIVEGLCLLREAAAREQQRRLAPD
ncbi:MAG TPA: hypothetical protein VGH27_08285 [Streptosporangiaceae bacterium]|jgi:hypothetical protein